MEGAIPLASQVGGHAGVLTTEDGSLIIKPALPLEHKFYQSLTTDPAFATLRSYAPKFIGTLKLEGKAEQGAEGLSVGASEGSGKESLVLENLSFPFTKPNILDIKLGTVLYDEEAPEDKKQRMIETARNTTSLESGVRLTGFQVYDNTTGQPVNTPKSYGKSIKVSDLRDGAAKFFPVASVDSTSGLSANLLLPILKAIRTEIIEIRAAFAALELRMVGGSLLLVYEGDAAKAAEGVSWMLDGGLSVVAADEDDEKSDDEDEKVKHSPVYSVKLIDFAHTRLVPEKGPDEGVLKGFDTTLALLDGRIKEVEAVLKD
ncbi:SAICAR synthase-like protein [Cylindrobasidium torrendii FP15055 ss-10]|uniref:Kinase n=1 Tax=Cylindrobasidium torrendii FP15055 ss-10 TaxID=1314674 RepID=A0A0D7BS39_9AGAR|nr:SAICAR synthase-like protein [Cylindrobasidium torrendii FP15055 ss-10]